MNKEKNNYVNIKIIYTSLNMPINIFIENYDIFIVGHGFHISPILAQHMAETILGKEKSIDLSIFSPERGYIKTNNIDESIDEFLEHYRSGSYEYGMYLPPFLSQIEYSNLFKQKIKDIYKSLEISYGIMPEVILMILFSDNQNKIITHLKAHIEKLKDHKKLQHSS